MLNFMATGVCYGLEPIIRLLKTVINIVQFAIPIALILLGIFDLGKAVMAGKEDEMKKSQGILIKRIIYAVLIFFVVFIVKAVMGIVAAEEANANNWVSCWDTQEGQ